MRMQLKQVTPNVVYAHVDSHTFANQIIRHSIRFGLLLVLIFHWYTRARHTATLI